MKVFAELPPGLSKAMERIVAALKNHAPYETVKFVRKEEDADLVIVHVIGYPETTEAVKRIKSNGQEYVIVQYCMRSTQRPNTGDWIDIWQHAQLVWSYYDLKELMREDGADPKWDWNIQFYLSPLGADPVFGATKPTEVKMYTMLTSGYVAESEAVNEVTKAIKTIGGRHFHLGPRDAAPEANAWGLGISDTALADVYSRCCWVAGLRRCEGFEMPAAEGLVCGARPIMFDAVHYRRWFGEFAEFIPEGSFDEVVDALLGIFGEGCRLVSENERQAAIARFDWKPIIAGFWERTLS